MIIFTLFLFFATCGGILLFIKSQKVPMVQPSEESKEHIQQKSKVSKLKTNRGLIKYIFLSAITFGIYGLVVMSSISSDINIIATKHDNKKTMHYCLIYFIFSWLTLGISLLIWYNNISSRIGKELTRRNITYNFGAGSFWGWHVLGSLILIGPFVYMHKLFKAMNLLAQNYNING